jgi:hypothetical protein
VAAYSRLACGLAPRPRWPRTQLWAATPTIYRLIFRLSGTSNRKTALPDSRFQGRPKKHRLPEQLSSARVWRFSHIGRGDACRLSGSVAGGVRWIGQRS